MKTIEQEAREWADNYCTANDNICDVTNKEVNLYLGYSFNAGAEFAQRWISVEEELPEEGMEILVITNTDKGVVKILLNENMWYFKTGTNIFMAKYYRLLEDDIQLDVTNWRPIEIK